MEYKYIWRDSEIVSDKDGAPNIYLLAAITEWNKMTEIK